MPVTNLAEITIALATTIATNSGKRVSIETIVAHDCCCGFGLKGLDLEPGSMIYAWILKPHTYLECFRWSTVFNVLSVGGNHPIAHFRVCAENESLFVIDGFDFCLSGVAAGMLFFSAPFKGEGSV